MQFPSFVRDVPLHEQRTERLHRVRSSKPKAPRDACTRDRTPCIARGIEHALPFNTASAGALADCRSVIAQSRARSVARVLAHPGQRLRELRKKLRKEERFLRNWSNGCATLRNSAQAVAVVESRATV